MDYVRRRLRGLFSRATAPFVQSQSQTLFEPTCITESDCRTWTHPMKSGKRSILLKIPGNLNHGLSDGAAGAQPSVSWWVAKYVSAWRARTVKRAETSPWTETISLKSRSSECEKPDHLVVSVSSVQVALAVLTSCEPISSTPFTQPAHSVPGLALVTGLRVGPFLAFTDNSFAGRLIRASDLLIMCGFCNSLGPRRPQGMRGSGLLFFRNKDLKTVIMPFSK